MSKPARMVEISNVCGNAVGLSIYKTLRRKPHSMLGYKFATL